MAGFRLTLLVCSLQAILGEGQTANSCGVPSDHLTNVEIQMVPDPPVKGKPFSLVVKGDLDEAIVGGNIKTDLQITALSFIHSKANLDIPFSYVPGLPKGPAVVTFGPTTLPSLPGSTKTKGQIKIVNQKGEGVACVDLDLALGSDTDKGNMMQSANTTVPHGAPVTSCSKPGDHLKNFSLVVDHGTVLVAGDLDEDVNTLSLNLDTWVEKFWVTIPMKSTIPISLSPPVPKGPFKISVGPSTGKVSPDPDVSYGGKVRASDGNGEEIFCLDINGELAKAAAPGILVV